MKLFAIFFQFMPELWITAVTGRDPDKSKSRAMIGAPATAPVTFTLFAPMLLLISSMVLVLGVRLRHPTYE